MSLPHEIVTRTDRKGLWARWFDSKGHRMRWKRLGATKPLAIKALRQLQSQLTAGVYDRRYMRLTLAEYYQEHYKPDYLVDSGSRSWHGRCRHMIEKFILPTIGGDYLDGITLYAAETWYRRMLADGKARRYARHIVTVLKTMLTRAEGRFIEANPLRKLRLLPSEHRIPEHLTPAQIGQLYRTLQGRDRVMFMVLLCCGLRKSEVVHLQWKDIDLDTGKLFVMGKPGHALKDRTDRHIDMTQDLVVELRAFAQGKQADAFVFTDPHGQQINDLAHYVKRMFAKARVRGSSQILRHTFASLLLSQGASLAELQQFMGHSSIVTTQNHYAAFMPGAQSTIHRIDFGLQSQGDVYQSDSKVFSMDGKVVVA